MTASTPRSLPLIDLARFRDPAADREEFLAELRRAAHDVGFFYVVGHGVPERGHRRQSWRRRRSSSRCPRSSGWRSRTCTRRSSAATPGSAPSTPAARADWREQIDIGPEREAVEIGPGRPGLAAADRAEPVAAGAARAARRRARLAGRGAAGQPRGAARAGRGAGPGRGLLRRVVRRGVLAAGQDRPLPRRGRTRQADAGRRRAQGLRLPRAAAAGHRRRAAGRRARTAAGSTPPRSPGRSWSTSARCWRSPPGGYLMATRHRVRQPARSGVDRYSVPFFLGPAPGRRGRAADPAGGAGRGGGRGHATTRTTRCTPRSGRRRWWAGCARTRGWPRSGGPTCSPAGPDRPVAVGRAGQSASSSSGPGTGGRAVLVASR